MPVSDYDEYCNRCGKNVEYIGWNDRSGFFDRKWDDDNTSTRQYRGDFICKECQ